MRKWRGVFENLWFFGAITVTWVGCILLIIPPFLEKSWLIGLGLTIVGFVLIIFYERHLNRNTVKENTGPQKKEYKREGSRLDSSFVRALYRLGYNGWFPSKFDSKMPIIRKRKFFDDEIGRLVKRNEERRKRIDSDTRESMKNMRKKKG